MTFYHALALVDARYPSNKFKEGIIWDVNPGSTSTSWTSMIK